MAFASFSEFLQMGNHAVYVWSAYILVFISLLFLFIQSSLRQKKLKKQLDLLKNEEYETY